MRLSVLLENTAARENLLCAHGLSVFIETARHKILFDCGPDDAFLRNARVLGADIMRADFCVLSHAHYDHTGGVSAFLEVNRTAAVYARKEAMGDFFSLNHGPAPSYIGLDAALKNNRRFILLDEPLFRLYEGVTLFQGPQAAARPLPSNAALLEKQDGQLRPDRFLHEQNLLIEEDGKIYLFCACAHAGIDAITEQAVRVAGRHPDHVIGGFHLSGKAMETSEGDHITDEIADRLHAAGVHCHTCHCTGEKAAARLREKLQDRFHLLKTGDIVTF